MCVIINNPTGQLLSEDKLRVAYANNPHGVGFMWHEDGHVNTIKALMDFNEFLSLHEALQGVPHAIHFRWRTVGDTSDDRCHPFPIFTKKNDGFDLWMMHNGTIEKYARKSGEKSDTQLFAEALRQLVEKWDNPLNVLHPGVLGRMAEKLGRDNKLLLMGSGGRTALVNSASGWFDSNEGPLSFTTYDGNMDMPWYSNKYSFIECWRTRDKMELKETRQNNQRRIR